METIDQRVAQHLPEPLWNFVSEACAINADALRMLPGSQLPEPARRLLVHDHDMTSMLAAFHAATLRVDLLQRRERDDIYLREVFLRAVDDDRVIEYGIIAIGLDQFTSTQRDDIRAGGTPLGALLHDFGIPFESRPIGFFSIATAGLPETRRRPLKGATCFGRFNRLSRRGGEPLAWIMEVLPAG